MKSTVIAFEGKASKFEEINPLHSKKNRNTPEVSSVFKDPHLAKMGEDLIRAFQKGIFSQNSGHLKEAERYFLKILKKYPDHIYSLINLSAIYIKQTNYSEAQNILKRVQNIEPQNTSALVNLGLIQLNQERYERAEHFLSQALEIEPSKKTALINMSYLAIKNYAPRPTSYYLNKLVEFYPEDIDILLNYAHVMAKQERYTKAIKMYRKCLQLHKVNNDTDLRNKIRNRISLLKTYILQRK